MCKAMEEMLNETVFKTTVRHIHMLMQHQNWTVQEALEALEIPESERPRYIAAI